MRAAIVFTDKKEPRLMLVFESDEERALFESLPDLTCISPSSGFDECSRIARVSGALFTLQTREDS